MPRPLPDITAPRFATTSFEIDEMVFEVSNRYKAVEWIGKGEATSCSARDLWTSSNVLIKKCSRIGYSSIECLRAFRDMFFMGNFNHANVLRLYDVYLPRVPKEDFVDLYMVLETTALKLSDCVLATKREDREQFLSGVVYYILISLRYIHSGGVLHMDLRPFNILVGFNAEIKLSNFGRACFRGEENKPQLADVPSLWYQAPEILLSSGPYTTAVDVWSVGCIMAEVCNGNHLLQGLDHRQQLEAIVNVLGSPSEEDIQAISSEEARRYVRCFLMNREASPLYTKLPNATFEQVDLIASMLEFNPEKRITVAEALMHPYVEQFYQVSEDFCCPPVPNCNLCSEENISLSSLKRFLGMYIQRYRDKDANEWFWNKGIA